MIRRNHLKAVKIALAVRAEVKKLSEVGPCTINYYTLQNGCAVASWLFYKVLRAHGMRPRLIYGEAYCYDHWWVQCGNEYWDLTATQFLQEAPEVTILRAEEAKDYNLEKMGRESLLEIPSWMSFYRPQLDMSLKRLLERFDHD